MNSTKLQVIVRLVKHHRYQRQKSPVASKLFYALFSQREFGPPVSCIA